jgi:hypothetical protein
MTQDTFLNADQFIKVKNQVAELFHFMRDTKDAKKILTKLSSKLDYDNIFGKKGVQGITGLLKAKSLRKIDINYPIVFKLSVEIDRLVEHEYSVINSLNDLRPFCPHFVGTYGMFNLPISRTFVYTHTEEDENIESYYSDSRSDRSESENDVVSEEESGEDCEDEEYKPEDVKLFMVDEEYLPTNVLFLEYVSNISFEKICKNPIQNKSLIISQILMILASLSISQQHLEFTHYDLHVENILLRECEQNAIFAYKIKDKSFLVPTFGFYPVIIDMGSSYSSALEQESMKTNISHYQNGLQPCMYDPVNDLHHFLLSALNEIEYESDEYYFLTTRMAYFFRHLPVLRKKGWKQLPHNILKKSVKFINECCKNIIINYKKKENTEKVKIKLVVDKKDEEINKHLDKDQKGLKILPVWIVLDYDLIEILGLGIRLPWSEKVDPELLEDITKQFNCENVLEECVRQVFPIFLKEFQKFDDTKIFDDPNDLLFMLRELVDIVYIHWDDIHKKTDKQTSKYIQNEYKKRLIKQFKDLPVTLNWLDLILNCKYTISILSSLFYKYLKDHVNIINDAYQKTEMRTPYDFIKWYKQNTGLRTVYNEETIIYVWDSDMKKSEKIMLKDKMELEEIEMLNIDKPIVAENKILSILKLQC